MAALQLRHAATLLRHNNQQACGAVSSCPAALQQCQTKQTRVSAATVCLISHKPCLIVLRIVLCRLFDILNYSLLKNLTVPRVSRVTFPIAG